MITRLGTPAGEDDFRRPSKVRMSERERRYHASVPCFRKSAAMGDRKDDSGACGRRGTCEDSTGSASNRCQVVGLHITWGVDEIENQIS